MRADDGGAMTREYVYVMRCTPASMVTTNGFRWPESGPVECPDWSPRAECGNGLHGWLWGEGDLSAGGGVWEDPNARWLVVRVLAADIVELNRKVKFPRGEVVFCGGREAAAAEICRLGATGPVHFSTATAGTRGTATAGDAGTATAGTRGTATAGYAGTATAGYAGTATAGDEGTATAGYAGTATAGTRGTATAGDEGIIAIAWYDVAQGRLRLARGLVGENGIEANVPYVVKIENGVGRLVRKES